jgi:MFS family permease
MTTATTSKPAAPLTIPLLALCQALFMSVQAMGIATTPLAAHAMLGVDKSLATLPVFLVQLGIMATTLPASLLMSRIGRRGGFSIGATLGIVSGIVSVLAVYQQSFWMLCAGSLLQGAAAAFAWYFRFAAADSAAPDRRAEAISLVMAGGVLAGFLGPETAKHAVDFLHPVTFAGVYVMVAAFSAGVLALIQFLRVPGLTAAERKSGGRPMREIVRQPAYLVALTSSMFGYAVMTLVMSATPLAMLACGFKFGDSATVIQGHVIAMFLPAFFTGSLIRRFGAPAIIVVGAVAQLGCAAINLAGIDFANFFLANILVGVGWSFTYIGGSTLLTETYTPAERGKVQGSHDFLVYTATATAAGASGLLQANAGWTAVNLAAIPAMLLVIAAAGLYLATQRRVKAQPAE